MKAPTKAERERESEVGEWQVSRTFGSAGLGC